ncbi:MAG: hypothetical protein LLF97_07680 [Planctomycetaceae bacterium]|nr:hypothetical protein [Planctomycetaceae bacterium]
MMRTEPLPQEVRELVLRTFQDFGAAIFCSSQVDETILIEEGRHSARSYRVDDFWAMWLVRVGVVQFYDAEGEMLRTINLLEDLEPQQMAA